MGRHCTVCIHPERAAIEGELIEHQPFRQIAARYGLSRDAVLRHHDDHLPAALLAGARAAEIAHGDDLVARLIELAVEARAVLDRGKEAQDSDLVLRAIARLERQIELRAKLAGQLSEAPVLNITLSPEWLNVQAVVVNALLPYPEARLAVAEALGTVDVAGSA